MISETRNEISMIDIVERCKIGEIKHPDPLKVFTSSNVDKTELFENMICFLLEKHTEGDTFSIKSKNGWCCNIQMDKNSGLIFERVLNRNDIIIYLGIGTFQNILSTCYPAFLLKSDNGVTYWDNIKDLESAVSRGVAHFYRSDSVSNFYQCLNNVLPKKKLLNFNTLLDVHKENNLKLDKIRSESIDVFSDAVIQCRDGEIKIIRYLFARDSEYFLHLFRYEPNKRIFKMDFDKIIVQTYIDYQLCFMNIRHPNIGKICDDVMQYIEFGLFIQDIHFIKEIYNLVSEECDYETLLKLNETVEKIISFD
jgi:hypothetical protein